MPFPLIPIAIGGGLVAAAARGAAWLAEQRVKEVNSEIQLAEKKATDKNKLYESRRLQRKKEVEETLATASSEYASFLAEHHLSAEELAAWKPEPWLQERIGELVIRRPLLIQPLFDRPASMNQMAAYRLFVSGQNLSRTNPALGQNAQGVGMLAAAGAYIAEQTNAVVDARKYTASVAAYLYALGKTIEGFDSRFASELQEDQRRIDKLITLLRELQASSGSASTEGGIRHSAIVHRSLVEFLTGLIGKYS